MSNTQSVFTCQTKAGWRDTDSGTVASTRYVLGADALAQVGASVGCDAVGRLAHFHQWVSDGARQATANAGNRDERDEGTGN